MASRRFCLGGFADRTERHGICMKIKRVMVAAPKSGSGKTTVVCALLQMLKKEGLQVVSCKCGPDYIDPMFHEKAIQVPSKNLDTFFTGEEGTRELFSSHVEHKDAAVLEGVMGLYDGLGGIREEGSSYHLAEVTGTPIVLVVDAKGMGNSLLPLVAGFLAYDKSRLIKGVVLNRVSKGYYETIKPLLEQEFHIKVAGFLPERAEYQIGSRHLGLVLPDELEDIQKKLRAASEEVSKTVSLGAIMEIAGSAGELEASKTDSFGAAAERAVIAVARDEAFCFYYADNIRLLEAYGAKISYFSPLRDEKLPEGCHALLIGGGYPELYAKELSGNSGIRAAVRQAAASGMPIVAECGGFMYLHSALTDKEGARYEMAGVLPGTCFYTGKLVRFGYIQLQEKKGNFLPEGEFIKGHEFHYYDSTGNGADVTAIKPADSREYPCVVEHGDCWMGFPHLYYPSNPAFAQAFVAKAEKYKEKMGRAGGAAPVGFMPGRSERNQEGHSHRFFENRACKYFPCHQGLERFNCLFCYCPLYPREACLGTPAFKEKDGKQLKICTGCTFPHQPENYDAVIKALQGKPANG